MSQVKTIVLLGGLLLSGWAMAAATNQESNGTLKLGDSIPAVSAVDQNGQSVQLAQAGRTGYTVVYFYPKAMTAGCTAQACSLRDAYADLQQKDVRVFGVSADAVPLLKEFATKDRLPFELLSDPDHLVMKAFGVPLINDQYATRQAYLFKDGKLVWFDTAAATDRQAADILAVISK